MRLTGRSVWLDYFLYRFRLDRSGSALFLLGLLLLVVGLSLFQNEWATLSGFALTIGGLQHAVDIRHHGVALAGLFRRPRRRCRREPTVSIAGQKFRMNQLSPSLLEVENGFSNVDLGCDTVLLSLATNSWLLTANPSISIDTGKRNKVATLIRSKRPELTELLALKFYESRTVGKDFRNEDKLCLASDLPPATDAVQCYLASYYDGFLTNEASALSIYEPSTNRTVVDFGELFPAGLDTAGVIRMKSVEGSQCANVIGVSSLGFTDDRKMALWQQSETAQQSEGLATPSGSGSLDRMDLRAASLKDTLTYGMERELREESSARGTTLERQEVGLTVVLGFFRWIRRGGKPEFCGISRIFKRSVELVPDNTEVHDGGARSLFYPAATAAEARQSISDIQESLAVSTPLAALLRILDTYIGADPPRFEAFIAAERPHRV